MSQWYDVLILPPPQNTSPNAWAIATNNLVADIQNTFSRLAESMRDAYSDGTNTVNVTSYFSGVPKLNNFLSNINQKLQQDLPGVKFTVGLKLLPYSSNTLVFLTWAPVGPMAKPVPK